MIYIFAQFLQKVYLEESGSPAKVRRDLCSQVVLNLHTVVFHSSCCRSFIYFHRVKVAKCPAHGRNSHSVLLFVNCVNSLIQTSFAVSILSAVCRVLQIALRTAILKKFNCRTSFGRASHNGLHPAGICTVLLTVPAFI